MNTNSPDLQKNSILKLIIPFPIRGQRVMIDRDIASLYGVETKVLNQAVKRNLERFPEEYMFKLTKAEKLKVVTNCDHLQVLKYSSTNPYAFTDYGIAMLATVLRSPQANHITKSIIQTFVNLRRFIESDGQLIEKFIKLQKKYQEKDSLIKTIYKVIDQMMEEESPKKALGFRTD